MRSQAFFNSDVLDSVVSVQLDTEQFGQEGNEEYQAYIRAVINSLKEDLP